MITFDLSQLAEVDPKHGVSKKELAKLADRIDDTLNRFSKRDQGFVNIIDDDDTVEGILTFAAMVEGKFDDVVVLGIGGSALGTICLQQSLLPLFANEQPRKKRPPRLHVLDNIDPSLIYDLETLLDFKRTLFVVVTKSGSTPETLAQYFYFNSRCAALGLKSTEHFVFITDPEKGVLRQIAENAPGDETFVTFSVPPKVGGRFSVLSPVGLMPAALMGLDVKALLKGARAMRDQFMSTNFDKNLPFQLAAIQYLLSEKGKIIHVLFPYSQRLIRFADWYRQLLAESIGKAKNDAGKTVNVGLTPLISLGVTDQHSQSQLYNEGPNDKFFMFIHVEDLGPSLEISLPELPDASVDYLNGVTFDALMHAEMRGSIQALTHNDRPNMTIAIPRVDAKTLGALLFLFEGSIAFLGEFYGINAFDQPGVELSKTLTKDSLMNS